MNFKNSAAIHLFGLLWAAVILVGTASAAPLTLDLTRKSPSSSELVYHQGSNRDPQGHVLTADGQSLLLDGQPFISISGEFHYSRYPRAEWRQELLKIRSGGCTAVSIYILWIYHEEEQGKFIWDDQHSLRDFLLLCQDVGLKVVLRIGPWTHGEVRNGGFPDWVVNSHTKLRTNDAAFLDLVRPYYAQIAEQTHGLYWKDGGPIFAVQIDNECDQPDYLLSLKAMAQKSGIDVPFYFMTGWGGVPIPKQELLPLFGAYSWGLWQTGPILGSFTFGLERNNKDMGAPLANGTVAPPPMRTPYLCVENGGGMESSYIHRVSIQPDDVGAVCLVRLGNGSTMPGYYMYQGGINPTGKFSFTNEGLHNGYGTHNQMPVKDYDFQAPLGAWGEVRGQYHLLQEQNLFIQDFGPVLDRMPAFMPDKRPRNETDSETVRWTARWKDDSGFIFFNNYQPEVPLPDHPGIQFALKTANSLLNVPAEPITIPSNTYGILPVQMSCRGATLQYATAQPLCYLDSGSDRWFFFKAIAGIDPDFVFTAKEINLERCAGDKEVTVNSIRIHHLTAGTAEAFALTQADSSIIHFVVLSPEQALTLYRAPFAGADRIILSKATVLADQGHLQLQASDLNDFSLAIFPALDSIQINNQKVAGSADGIFARFTPSLPAPSKLPEIVAEEITPPGSTSPSDLPASDDNAWAKAAVWKLHIPKEAEGRHLLVQVHYLADAARLYSGETLLDDNYYDAKPFDFGLWRIPEEQWSDLTLKVMPYTDNLLTYLPNSLSKTVSNSDPAQRNKLTVSMTEEINLDVAPVASSQH